MFCFIDVFGLLWSWWMGMVCSTTKTFGLACHLGVLSRLPCIGVAKNLLQVQGVEMNEEHQSQIASLQKGGDRFPLTTDSGKVLGRALHSPDGSTKPVYVSVGQRSTWTRPCASHTPAAATVSQSLSETM
ncbi:unnamed protein product [Oncorhynchus mykiss]|uniref:Uncharacterized protein n=1 Tax=Oncorhynchus mykiss TaxID=8022 RepID=A0A060WQN4_ONCMY|nr:unnamed protein product [Oncorhynchus mykiss]